MKKADKQSLIDELHGKLETVKSAVLTDYKGMTVAEITELRNELRKSQVEFRVIKNTLAIRAAKGTSAEKLEEYLKGTTGWAMGFGDAVAPAKVLTEIAKKQKKLVIRVGLVEGQLADENALKAIASLPSREVLLSQMAGSFSAPASQMARLLSATVARFGFALTALRDKKEQG